ncbi:MAG: hypothetical protein O2971_04545 [Proteobacteria bacterium]|nr:hypothetical protein [Pseudomonadota bacterium]
MPEQDPTVEGVSGERVGEASVVEDIVGRERDDYVSLTTLSPAAVITGVTDENRRQFIADLLYEGLQALDANRLLTPIDDNAHARFKRVLAFDPDNEIALQGLQDIVGRYLQLAGEASRQGLFSEAEILLGRARFVDENHPDLVIAWLGLQAEMTSGDLFFTLDANEFTRRSDKARATLTDIARQAQQHNAFFLITAPNDDLARWMFSIMQEAVIGYRLRGNIELAVRASIRLRMPQD